MSASHQHTTTAPPTWLPTAAMVVGATFLLVGILGFVPGITTNYGDLTFAGWYLLIGGLVYAVLWIYGVAVGEDSSANFVPLTTADNWLHFVLAVGMIALGAIGLQRVRRTVGTATSV